MIRSFNRNQPYDRFAIEQLAGDLLPGATRDQVVATGFTRCHVSTSEGGSIEEEVYVRNVVDRVDTLGTVFLGLTVGCARCHDHKYDPLRQEEYYQLFAFFNSIDGPALDGNAARYPPIELVPSPEQEAMRGKLATKTAEVRKAIADAVAAMKYEDPGERKERDPSKREGYFTTPWKVYSPQDSFSAWLKAEGVHLSKALPADVQAGLKLPTAKRNAGQQKLLRDYFLEHVCTRTRARLDPLNRELAAFEKQQKELESRIAATLVFRESKQPRPAYLLKRGEYDQRGKQVQRAAPAFLPGLDPRLARDRLALANWLVSADHPLTARVAANRLWQQCFGTGLVKTAEDLGSQGEPPSHPELLDWLAVEFRNDGWDVKRFLRRIVLSSTYRQTSRMTADRVARDPGNRLLARGPRLRLDAETLRDQALAVSGLLVDRLGGPSVKPPQPAGLWEAVAYSGSNTAHFQADTELEKIHRRSMYTFWKRTAAPPQMTAFDAPSREQCCVRRERTNTPLQALLVLNERQMIECALALGERAMREGGTRPDERVNYLFRLVTAREPDAREQSLLLRAYADHRAHYQQDTEAARKLAARSTRQLDTRVSQEELAAWALVANIVLNLDEVLNKG